MRGEGPNKDLPFNLPNPDQLKALPVVHDDITGKEFPAIGWLFDPRYPLDILCGEKAAEPGTVAKLIEFKPPYRPKFAIRKSPQGFTIGGKARRTAGAATFGFERETDFDESNMKDRTEELTFEGAIGFRLSDEGSVDTAYAFARYELDRDRTFPKPALAKGERRDSEDTNVLELGVISDLQLMGSNDDLGIVKANTDKLFLVTSLSYVFDFPKNNERIRSRNLFELTSPKLTTPICAFGNASSRPQSPRSLKPPR